MLQVNAHLCLILTIVLFAAARIASATDLPAVTSDQAKRQILVTFDDEQAGRPQLEGPPRKAYHNRTQYAVSSRVVHDATDVARDFQLKQLSGWPIKALGVYCVVFELTQGLVTDELLKRLVRDERVESAQPMQLFNTQSLEYNDPYLHLQHHIHSIQAELAHQWVRGNGVQIIIIDTGVDTDHNDLRGRIEMTRNFVEHQPNIFRTDIHGTAVAGVIAAVAGNETGIIGVAPEVSLIVLKACWQPTPDSSAAVCDSFTLAKAFAYALELDGRVINLSLTGPYDPLIASLIGKAVERGKIVIAAVGKPGMDHAGFPASIPEVVAVQAMQEGSYAEFTQSTIGEIFMAPGEDILTVAPNDGFDFASGSSMAAAQISGIAALLLEQKPDMSFVEFTDLLRSSIVAPNPLVNACAAVSQLMTGENTCPAVDDATYDLYPPANRVARASYQEAEVLAPLVEARASGN